MNMIINQVGKRWFLITAKGSSGKKFIVDVEASYANRTKWEVDEMLTKEAGYKVWSGKSFRKWTLTGKGAEKYREQITAALDGFLDASERPNTLNEVEAV